MNRFLVAAAILVVALALWPVPAPAQSETAVTGAGAGIFSGSAVLYSVRLQSLEFGQGVIILEDGSATGDFQSLLLGTSLLSQPQNLTLEGTVSSGSAKADGSVIFGGTATVDLGLGTPPLRGIPFSVTATTQGLRLRINTITLPVGTLTAGSITIQ
jgi:hypothetical protein